MKFIEQKALAIISEINVLKHVESLCQALQESYSSHSSDGRVTFEISAGARYFQILKVSGSIRTPHCFVNKTNGKVYSRRTSTADSNRHVYNLLNERSRIMCLWRADWKGEYLRKRRREFMSVTTKVTSHK